MMTRAAPAPSPSLRDLAAIAVSIVVLGSATVGVSSYADGPPPIADFLNRAQSEANARRFTKLLDTLGVKPPSSPIVPRPVPPLPPQDAQKPIAGGSQPDLQPLARTTLPPVTIVQHAPPEAATQKIVVNEPPPAVRKPSRRVVRTSPDVWVRRASGILHVIGVRF
jgi:hypothetical protein